MQVAEIVKKANVIAEEETTQPIDKNEQKEDSRSLEHQFTAQNTELDKVKIEFYKALKEFEGPENGVITRQTRSKQCSHYANT